MKTTKLFLFTVIEENKYFSGIFAEAVVTGKVDRDYSLEYTPYGSKDSTKKVTWILKDTCVGIEDLDWQNRTDVISMKDFMKYSSKSVKVKCIAVLGEKQ